MRLGEARHTKLGRNDRHSSQSALSYRHGHHPTCCRGPTGTLLNDLAEASHDAADCAIIFVSEVLMFCRIALAA